MLVFLDQKKINFLFKKNDRDVLFMQFYFWFGLVSLFNGISTIVGYLMPKTFS